MTPTEKRNLAQVVRWEQTYNDNVDAMVDELYAENCEVIAMFTGTVLRGRAQLRALEHQISAAMPDRRLHVVRAIAAGDVVTAECTGHFGAATVNACVVLTFDANGQIVSDHTYSPDPTGLSARR
jgi:hypothetical protein